MPLKKGGGNKLQYYDEATGEYDDEEKFNLNELDKKNLVMFHYFGLNYNDIKFHFPKFKIHDSEYCEIFCKFLRNKVIIKDVNFKKATYLLSFNESSDKSKFLAMLGYNKGDENKLIYDIISYTDLNSIKFAGLNEWGLRVKAKTILKKKILTSIWMVNENMEMKFITMIPGGDKTWKE